ncbi:hypothetical protein F5884DRAFT_100479 [Xylogone sp. PMI_703]|nr:hypothetical protein F5884DRAFT_100479 [Xylogone sp. PMI_703]
MYTLLAPTLLIAAALQAAPSRALWANTNTQCAAQCGNVLASTSGEEIPCTIEDYSAGTGYGGFGGSLGPTFTSCINCQLSSNQTDPESGRTDLELGLYNLRYAVSWCVFGYPNNTAVGSNPCSTSRACGLEQAAFEFDGLSQNTTAYGYCADWYSYELVNCQSCLAVNTDEYYLNNFVTVLEAGCDQKPNPGSLLSIQGTVFSNIPVNITTPGLTPSGLPSSGHGPLSLGGKVGIVVAGVVAILMVTGFCIVCRGRRRRRAEIARHQRESGYVKWYQEQQMQAHGGGMSSGNVSAGGFFDSPQSQQPLHHGRPWAERHIEDESPASAMGEKAYFSPYTSQYSSPISAQDMVQGMQDWPIDRKGSISGYGDRDRKEPEPEPFGERIELQEVKHASPPPVLVQPGPGRTFLRTALGEEDVKRGDAI